MTTGSMLTRQQVADELAVSVSTVGNLIKSRTLYALQVGTTYRIPREVLDAYKRGDPCPYGTGTDPATDPDVTTWPPTPSLLAALDDTDPDPQATDDRQALDAATFARLYREREDTRQALDAATMMVSDEEHAAIYRPNPPMDPTTGHPA